MDIKYQNRERLYTIEDLENKKTFDKNMVGNGIISQRILLEHNDLYNKNLSKDNIKQYYYDTEIGKFVLINKAWAAPAYENKNRLRGRFRLPFCDDSNSCINAM